MPGRGNAGGLKAALDRQPVMDQLGHTDPGFTLRVYRHGMRRDPTTRGRLLVLVGAPNGLQHVTLSGSDKALLMQVAQSSDGLW